jgi:ABC-type antimicrobial peptide transport system permease subunit
VSAALRHALARLAVRRGRALVAAGGILTVSAMVAAATTVSFGVWSGFDRAADRAGLPDAIAHFDDRRLNEVAGRAESLANVREVSYRLEAGGTHVRAGGQRNSHGILVGVLGGPRGYAVVAGRDVAARAGEVVVERGLAEEWRLSLGDVLDVHHHRGGFREARLRVVGVAVAPETFAYPLTQGPRLFVPYGTARRLAGERPGEVNAALVWVRDRDRLEITLAQARAASFGLDALELQTRAGLEAVIGQATGIAVSLIAAFSLVALGLAGLMLAASAHAEVQRRREAIGLLRALGASPREVAGGYALEAALVAAPAAGLGALLGWAVSSRPTGRLLVALNELAPGVELAGLLVVCALGVVAVVAAATALPAWRIARRSPVENLRAGDVAGVPLRAPLPGGAGGLGVRLTLARPVRSAAMVAVLGASASLVLLLLTIGSLLRDLEDSPVALGKRYQLSVVASPGDVSRIAALEGVAAAAPRYETNAADSFDLGQAFEVVAFPGDHTVFEAPDLAEGRRIRTAGEVEVGLGLAQALDLHPGESLAAQVFGGGEIRFRVVGIVRALRKEGRIAYVRPDRLIGADPFLRQTVAVRVAAGASVGNVRAELRRLGFVPDEVGGLGSEGLARSERFVDVLGALLFTVAGIDGLVCLYALVQMLALTAQERRRAVAVMRACGGSRAQVTALFAGAALTIAALAAPVALALERLAVGPLVSRLAVSYVDLPLAAGLAESLVVVAGLVAIALGAAIWVARDAVSEPVVVGLRDE